MYNQFKNYKIHSTFILLLCLASCKSPEKDNLIQDSSFLDKITSYFEKEVEGNHLKDIGGLAYNEGETKPYTGRVVYLSKKEGLEGKINVIGHYKNGLKDGEGVKYFYDNYGTVEGCDKEYYLKGKKVAEMSYDNTGKLRLENKIDEFGISFIKRFNSDGILQSTYKVDNNENGERIYYYPSGKILAKSNIQNGYYKNPSEDGTVYWENGKIQRGLIIGRFNEEAIQRQDNFIFDDGKENFRLDIFKLEGSSSFYANNFSSIFFVIQVFFNKDGVFEKFKIGDSQREIDDLNPIKIGFSDLRDYLTQLDYYKDIYNNDFGRQSSPDNRYSGSELPLNIIDVSQNNYGIKTSNLLKAERIEKE
jgi:antitoxin component YwqK of YwqJK toxin-antitoxin module